MLTIDELIAVLSLVLGAISLGYAIGKDRGGNGSLDLTESIGLGKEDESEYNSNTQK